MSEDRVAGDRPVPRPPRGHRSVPHTGDLAVEAWAPTREECIAEAVQGMVRSFADIPDPAAGTPRDGEVTADTDAQLLAAVLEDVIYRMDTAGELPADVSVRPTPDGVHVRYTMTGTETVTQIGAVPKAVALHGLRLAQEPQESRDPLTPREWVCHVTLDV
ncbi:archease [Streptomyces sannanensis]|uniref:Archease n=1 Tax=Streptomyces sannanensis TaxID=285536 RepID=A0ABP6S8M3_9ACTN